VRQYRTLGEASEAPALGLVPKGEARAYAGKNGNGLLRMNINLQLLKVMR